MLSVPFSFKETPLKITRGRPVSRILSPPRANPTTIDDHSSDHRVATIAIAANPNLLGQKQPCLATRGPYLALLPVGLAVPPLLPAAWWALTPPFHPYFRRFRLPDLYESGFISVALSVGLPRPGITRYRIFLESGLSSTAVMLPRSSSLPRVRRVNASPVTASMVQM